MKSCLLITLLVCSIPVSNSLAQVDSDANQFGIQSSTTTASSGQVLHRPGCNVQLIQDVELPALESGQIRKMEVKPGDIVNVNDVLVRLDDTRAQLALQESSKRYEIANERATDMTEVNTAYKRYQLAHTEFAISRKLSKSGSVSAYEHNRTKYSMEVSQLEYQAAQKARELAATEAAVEQVRVQAAQASIERHMIQSPIVGVVVEQKREEGEWVTAGDTIMRLARMDRLRVPAIIEGDDYDPHEIADRPVTVTLTMARGQQVEFSGEIVFAEIEKRLGNKYMVWAEVDNRMVDGTNSWMLKPGSVVDMQIHLGDAPIKSASANGTAQTRNK